nr:hypothetical protein [Tanacetum cinerariifolium]
MPSFNSIVRAFASLGHDLDRQFWGLDFDSELEFSSAVIDMNSSNSRKILLREGVLRDNLAYNEYGIRLMLAPRSAKALQEKVLLKSQGIRKLPRSLSLGGTLFWIITELLSFKKAEKYPQFPLHYESEPGYNENYNSHPYDSSSLPQQYPCYAYCGGPHMNFQCQPMNQDSYNSNSLGFDQPQPPQSPVIHQPPQELSIQEIEDLKQQYLDELKRLKDDDDEDYTSAVTLDEPVLSTEEPDNSLSMGDEHLDTILATESDEFIKSGVENLIIIPSESEGIPEHVCDVPSHDNSLPLDISKYQIEDFSESNEEFSSIDDDSFSIDDIDYVEASPPDSEIVSSEVMEIVIPEVGGIDDDILPLDISKYQIEDFSESNEEFS